MQQKVLTNMCKLAQRSREKMVKSVGEKVESLNYGRERPSIYRPKGGEQVATKRKDARGRQNGAEGRWKEAEAARRRAEK